MLCTFAGFFVSSLSISLFPINFCKNLIMRTNNIKCTWIKCPKCKGTDLLLLENKKELTFRFRCKKCQTFFPLSIKKYTEETLKSLK